MEEQKSQFDRVKEITDQLEEGIANLFESDAFKQYLTTLSKFHNYSLNNTLLIAMQKPDATLVAGYTAWQKQFGRQVQKGEKAIKILAPTPYKKKVNVEKQDPNTGEVLRNPDGTAQTEIQEVMQPAFKIVNVFDISSTEGKELPTIGVDELLGDVNQYENFMNALKASCPVPISFEQIDSGAKGYYHQTEQRIALQEGMSEVQTVKTLIHEMAHQKLHAVNPTTKEPVGEKGNQTRHAKEVEAESVAFTVCQHFGIDTSDYSFAYVAGWSHGKETPELKASLNTIRQAASEMITTIEGNMQELSKDLNIKQDVVEENPFEKQENALPVAGHVDVVPTAEKPEKEKTAAKAPKKSVRANLQKKQETVKEQKKKAPTKKKAKEDMEL
ncbi:MAG: ArdC-like ssDNA-binding domain-containing protein [Clostridium sp.]